MSMKGLYAQVDFLCLEINVQSLWHRGQASQVRTSVVDASIVLISFLFLLVQCDCIPNFTEFHLY